jgi:hypothetical protein
MNLAVPFCDNCFSARRKKLFTGIGLLIAVLPTAVLIIVAMRRINMSLGDLGDAIALVTCLLMAISGLVLSIGNKDILYVVEIDNEHGFGLFRGASPNFLRRLPDING